MTGYGVAFPKQSKWLPLFNEALMSYREHGDLERLHRSEHGTWDMGQQRDDNTQHAGSGLRAPASQGRGRSRAASRWPSRSSCPHSSCWGRTQYLDIYTIYTSTRYLQYLHSLNNIYYFYYIHCHAISTYLLRIYNIYTWQVRCLSLHCVPGHGAPLLQVCDLTHMT